jgi:hypothetical protein
MMKLPRTRDTMPALLAGLLSAIYMQTVTGWWLNSGRGVAYADTMFFVLSLVVGCFGARLLPVRVAALWVGVQIGLTAFLFWTGPGTIFPLVIFGGGLISGFAICVGGGVGWLCARLLGHVS